jgi:hypothetical protein
MPSLKEVHGQVLRRAFSGAVKGGAAGAAASLATGAAVIVTTPAWLPFIGSSAVVALATVTAWSMTGSAVGAVMAGARACFQHQREERAFADAFPPTPSERNAHEQ